MESGSCEYVEVVAGHERVRRRAHLDRRHAPLGLLPEARASGDRPIGPRRRDGIVQDERDAAIRRRALAVLDAREVRDVRARGRVVRVADRVSAHVGRALELPAVDLPDRRVREPARSVRRRAVDERAPVAVADRPARTRRRGTRSSVRRRLACDSGTERSTCTRCTLPSSRSDPARRARSSRGSTGAARMRRRSRSRSRRDSPSATRARCGSRPRAPSRSRAIPPRPCPLRSSRRARARAGGRRVPAARRWERGSPLRRAARRPTRPRRSRRTPRSTTRAREPNASLSTPRPHPRRSISSCRVSAYKTRNRVTLQCE